MTPVRLRLHNFLSYGTEAPELDFEQFDVAVLSGGNGQGKSALLDAITWALWGEARKSAGAGKPDEELLHTGASRMEVEFEFEQEGIRYRVLRSFSRSSSGRTTRPGLEFYVLDAAAGKWNALTSDAMRSTQAEIDRRVGIDYDTFINSSLLLQGRSDEFTRRRPAERKQVLGRILGLDRFALLADAAAAKHSAAREAVRGAEQHLARLRDALQNESAWRAEHAQAESEATQARERRDALASEEAGLGARVAALDEQERAAGRQRRDLQQLEDRGAKLSTELDATTLRAEEARGTIERRAEIEAAAARHAELSAEQATTEAQRRRHAELTFEMRDARREVERVEAGLQERLARLRAEEVHTRERLAEEDARVAERPALEARLGTALAAADRISQLTRQRAARDELRRQRETVEAAITASRDELQRDLVRADLEVEQLAAIPSELAALTTRSGELAIEVERIQNLHRSRDEIRATGTEHRLRRDGVLAEVARLREAVDRAEERRRALTSTTEGICPTCGTPLTKRHRATMMREFGAEIDALLSDVATREGEASALRESCERLAADFRSYDQAIAQANGAAGHYAHAVAEIARLEALLDGAPERRRRAAHIRTRIERGRFAEAERKTLAALDKEIEALDFDEAAFDAARIEAAQVDPLQEMLTEIDAAAARRDRLAVRQAEIMNELEVVASDVEAGLSAGPLRDQLGRLEEELADVDYDADAEKRVVEELAELSDAIPDMARLARAEVDLADASAQLAELAAEAETCHVELAEARARLAALTEALAERSALVAQLDDVAARRRDADRAVDVAARQLGGLREKLARCDLDRALLADEQVNLKAAKRDFAVSRHLRQAFGPHGIPSLIIEETLPEIESRANALLERLCGDGTRVALDTVKETRSGARDTLEIRITGDNGATRPYETYSGGEAFRVNFALRIALAQLLADRAGVRLRTLVVDEGFGTQDRDGRQGLIEAIGVIQADFDKVLVISHLDEVKDAFPVRIEVTKTPLAGSTFTVFGAG